VTVDFEHRLLYYKKSGVAHAHGSAVSAAISRLWAYSARKASASGVTDHASHLGDHFLVIKRLAEKPAVGGNIDMSNVGEKGWQICAEIIGTLLTNKMPN
jgi:hypothetical protein